VIKSTVASQKYAHPRKYAHPPLSLKVIARLESTPTQQTKIISSSMHSDESVVYMYVWASSWSSNRGAVQSNHTRPVLSRDTTAQDVSKQEAAPDSRSS